MVQDHIHRIDDAMRILVGHNYYTQPGGEDTVFHSETHLLESKGHEVIRYTDTNRYAGIVQAPVIAFNTLWSVGSKESIQDLIGRTNPTIAHFHNTFFQLSPSVYDACQSLHVPVVQTLHNYRLVCPTATLFRDQVPCEDCLGKALPWPGVIHRCYHDSAVQSAMVALMLAFHHWKHTWREAVDVYIALTEFARRIFIAGGLPAEKIVVKPNFVHPDPGPKNDVGEYALFVGRLSHEKGLQTMLAAWRMLPTIPLKIVGSGPLRREIDEMTVAPEYDHVDMLGLQSHEAVFKLLKGARLLIFPSEWYEGFPITILEAFACGVPVIASELGSMEEIIEHNRTGLLFKASNADDLADNVKSVWNDTHKLGEMSSHARQAFKEKYTSEKNYQKMMSIYEMALEAS